MKFKMGISIFHTHHKSAAGAYRRSVFPCGSWRLFTAKAAVLFMVFAGSGAMQAVQAQLLASKKPSSSPLSNNKVVSEKVMQAVYDEVKTPYKYGLVMVPPSNDKMLDCPSIFKKEGKWYMVYIVFNGRGYETWLGESEDLLHWKSRGRLMAFSDSSDWDANQKAGYIALGSMKWGGNYTWQSYKGKHWMSYFGGNSTGYEKGLLSLSIAWTKEDPAKVHPWHRLGHPVLMSTDKDVRWWENHTQYKSTVIWDKQKHTGHPFVMYYNANGDSISKTRGAERIGMAVSDDMIHWKRYLKDPVLDHYQGITGDPVIQRIGNLYVMFYFGAFWKDRKGAFNRFACSYDLIHWTDWTGPNLIEPSTPYDDVFAHKSFVVKHKGVVYHYYCAVNKAGQRGIAVATSKDLGVSELHFLPPPAKKKEEERAGKSAKERHESKSARH